MNANDAELAETNRGPWPCHLFALENIIFIEFKTICHLLPSAITNGNIQDKQMMYSFVQKHLSTSVESTLRFVSLCVSPSPLSEHIYTTIHTTVYSAI